MILVGNQRGGANNLAHHLLSPENEHVRVHEISDFVADDLHGAFNEAHAISRGTRCQQFLYSLSLNPPEGKAVSAFPDRFAYQSTSSTILSQACSTVSCENSLRGFKADTSKLTCGFSFGL